ncbi:lysophospholipid acyltransferase family protein [Roseateles sp. DAIF2]|uniref:lysophospholipid acyltransferase family protein n=1 Tax=Roseateles sp. DAIF2 TaxID=2714952 RepID=UPI0018A306B7|nr:lysophospholipid acyltransferase family protein [Roseateles sp. DAIF2]QPF72341.1 lysophospholipid acyltransferase family protein [Roseateles sp. DAIF2]
MLQLFRALSRCPLWLLHGFGAMAGWLSYLLSPSYRRRFQANVRGAGLTAAQARPAIAHAGRMIAELPWLWLRRVPLGPVVRWEGGELVETALAQQRGLVLLTPHLGCFEVTAQAYAEAFGARAPITVLFRPARKAWMRELMDGARERKDLAAAPASLAGVRQMLRALRQGQTVGLLPDQVPPDGLGAWAPFFGRPAYTMTLAAKLSMQSGAPLLLIWGERLSWGRGYVVRIAAGPSLPADSTPESAAAIINKAMEDLIRLAPQQYLWGYHRYKQPRQLPASAPQEAR